MKKTLTLFLGIFLLHSLLVASSGEAFKTVWVSDEVACLVGRVWLAKERLSIAYKMSKVGSDVRLHKGAEAAAYDRALNELVKDNTTTGDCALVQLATWLNDASIGETIEFHISRRGKRMVPLLKFALDHPIAEVSKEDETARKELLRDCIKGIESGIVVGFNHLD